MLKTTVKKIHLNFKEEQRLSILADKLHKRLPHLRPEALEIQVLIKKTLQHYLPKRHYHPSFSSYIDKKANLGAFTGFISVKLPHKKIVAHFIGKTVLEAFHYGRKELEKQLQRYKETHFKSQSRYPSKASIRRIL